MLLQCILQGFNLLEQAHGVESMEDLGQVLLPHCAQDIGATQSLKGRLRCIIFSLELTPSPLFIDSLHGRLKEIHIEPH